jgi:tetratricopeptide (TPR) repeat protein
MKKIFEFLFPTADQYIEKGNIKAQNSDLNGAIKDYTRAIEIQPRTGYYFIRGTAKVYSGDIFGAINDFNIVIEADPLYAPAYFSRGSANSLVGDNKRAIADFSKAIELNPNITEAYFGRGLEKFNFKDFLGAILDFNLAIDLNSNDADAYNYRGLAKYNLEDYRGAIEDYNKAIEINPNSAEVYKNKDIAKSKIGEKLVSKSNNSNNLEISQNKAIEYYNSGVAKVKLDDLKGALQDIDKAMEFDPNNADYYYFRGSLKAIINEHKGAIEDFSNSIKINSKNAEVYYYRGTEQYILGNIDEAFLDWLIASELGSIQPNDLIKKFFILMQPDQEYYLKAEAKYKIGDYKEAIEHYNRAIEFNPYYAIAYANRGNAKENLGDLIGAIQDYTKALEINPISETYTNRGNANDNLGNHKEAIQDYNKAIEINPNYSSAYYNRGIAKSKLINYKEAIQDFNKAIDINPNYANAYNSRGIIKENLGDNTGALADFNKAIEFNPNFLDAYKNRDLARAKLENNYQYLKNQQIPDITNDIPLEPINNKTINDEWRVARDDERFTTGQTVRQAYADKAICLSMVLGYGGYDGIGKNLFILSQDETGTDAPGYTIGAVSVISLGSIKQLYRDGKATGQFRWDPPASNDGLLINALHHIIHGAQHYIKQLFNKYSELSVFTNTMTEIGKKLDPKLYSSKVKEYFNRLPETNEGLRIREAQRLADGEMIPMFFCRRLGNMFGETFENLYDKRLLSTYLSDKTRSKKLNENSTLKMDKIIKAINESMKSIYPIDKFMLSDLKVLQSKMNELIDIYSVLMKVIGKDIKHIRGDELKEIFSSKDNTKIIF